MVKLPPMDKGSQEAIFSSCNWWDKKNGLLLITRERCDYIESCVNRVFGQGALRQQEVLEVGCGGGLICEELAQRGAGVVGIDPSQGAVETARIHARQSGLGQNIFVERGYGEQLPYANGSFSVVVCLDVLEHVRSVRTTLQEISRVLAPGGIFIFDTINRTLLAYITVIWLGERFFQRYGLLPGLHTYGSFIKPAELQAELITNKLHLQEMTGFTPHLKGRRITLAPGGPKFISYVGYAIKEQ